MRKALALAVGSSASMASSSAKKVKAENGGEVAVGGPRGRSASRGADRARRRPRWCRVPSRADRRAACRRSRRIGQRGERRFKEIAARERAPSGREIRPMRSAVRAALLPSSEPQPSARSSMAHQSSASSAAGVVFAPVDQVMKGTVVHRARAQEGIPAQPQLRRSAFAAFSAPSRRTSSAAACSCVAASSAA